MNNPAIYPPQNNPYATGYGNPMAQSHMMANAPPQFFPQSPFPPGGFPDQFQNQTPQHPTQRVSQPGHPGQNAGFHVPQNRSPAVGSGGSVVTTYKTSAEHLPRLSTESQSSTPIRTPASYSASNEGTRKQTYHTYNSV